RQYVLADRFFMGAFGGSYLNHQYLICACVPIYPDAENSPAKGSISVLDRKPDGSWSAQLSERADSPASALDGAPKFVNSSNLTPANYAGDGRYYTINTMQPPYQPSGVAPAAGRSELLADLGKPSALPAQTQATIADMLDKKGVDWAWYGGGWNLASEEGRKPASVKRELIYSLPLSFQPHHQPFNYYAAFDPVQPATAAYRAAHLRDFDSRFLQEAAAGKLPPVSFYKPQGNLNQHAGYASVKAGDDHVADVIAQLQKSPQWRHMLVVVTYDENGGFWDHVAPPKGDLWGPGTRIPALIVSPWAKKGVVDHTPYDTASILRFITRRWGLETLPGIRMRDEGLARNGSAPMGDLTQALDFAQTAK
ncbi:MAG: acid phosphatase, partial [Burkholderiaceae bacterium]